MMSEDTTIKKAKRVFKKGKRKPSFDPKAKFGSKSKSKIFEEEIREVDRKLGEFNSENANTFEDFPITQLTLKGLTECNYIKPTLIQKLSLPLSLQGSNILGAAKTGSGKTLAFVIPILEKLYRLRWSPPHGIGALIITPTRELAKQIFHIFQKVGKYHNFSAGLIIGGRDVESESRRLMNLNIVISTPGRLLHHLRETYGFDLNTLQLLVLDEADRMLDMGFKKELNNIIESLPEERQTLLYSATQTRCRTDLQRLNWKNYFLVCEKVTDKSELISMPPKLEQIFMVCKAEEKINLLFSFIVQNVKRKLLVFMSTCKQVRFIHEAFQKINKDVTFLAIHGSMKQKKRSEMFDKFLWKKHCVMFATDVACRGLDFPAVDWVVQMDCPADVETYVHRVGRTARYEDDGMSLLFLLPNEKDGMLKELEGKGITLQEEKPKKGKVIDIERKLESLVMDSQQWEDFARKALLTYLKSVFYMKNKDIFNMQAIDQTALAKSLGLQNTSKIQNEFLAVSAKAGEKKSSLKNSKKRKQDEDEDSADDLQDSEVKNVTKPSKVNSVSKVMEVKKLLKKGVKGTKIVFDDDEPKSDELEGGADLPQSIEERRKMLLERDIKDNELSKKKLSKKRSEIREKTKRENMEKFGHRERRPKAGEVETDEEEDDEEDDEVESDEEDDGGVESDEENDGGVESEEEGVGYDSEGDNSSENYESSSDDEPRQNMMNIQAPRNFKKRKLM